MMERGRPVCRRGLGDHLGAEHVVLHGLAGVLLHHRHVFVCGGVEDELRAVAGEDRVDAAGVGDVADEGFDGGGGMRGA
ncbi:MAG: hypothetical protein EOP08_17985 [Proteobacteria bacterium]|nr:MAG: hypothetical protein EOP08_17985 [Pseudomonadota bacterium]